MSQLVTVSFVFVVLKTLWNKRIYKKTMQLLSPELHLETHWIEPLMEICFTKDVNVPIWGWVAVMGQYKAYEIIVGQTLMSSCINVQAVKRTQECFHSFYQWFVSSRCVKAGPIALIIIAFATVYGMVILGKTTGVISKRYSVHTFSLNWLLLHELTKWTYFTSSLH